MNFILSNKQMLIKIIITNIIAIGFLKSIYNAFILPIYQMGDKKNNEDKKDDSENQLPTT